MRRTSLAFAVIGLSGCTTTLPTTEGGPNVAGTWSGSTPQAALTIVLTSSSCTTGGGFQSSCSGNITGGSYSDVAHGLNGSFAQGSGDDGAYFLVPPAGANPETAPLPGWTFGAEAGGGTALDSATSRINVQFINGTFSSNSAVAGTVVFTYPASPGGYSDSAAMVLTRQ